MVSKRVRIVSVAVGLAAFMASGAAFAQAPAGKDAAAAGGGGDKGDGYGYEFDDDPLSAGGFGPNDATIRVRPRAARTTLIRPRIQFVDEMLKSVENL
jgi:hypothetical protein